MQSFCVNFSNSLAYLMMEPLWVRTSMRLMSCRLISSVSAVCFDSWKLTKGLIDETEGSRPVVAKVQSESDENKGLATEETEVAPVSKTDEERGLRQLAESQIAVEVKLEEKASDQALVGLLQEEKLALRKEFDTKIEELESEWKRTCRIPCRFFD